MANATAALRSAASVAVDDVVDEAAVERLAAADVATGRHHLQRLRHADETRQPLRAAGAGEQAEVHLGQPELRRRDGHPVVRAQRNFESAAEGRAVDRGDHRDRGVLHRGLHLLEADGLRRAAAELADVGTGDERPAVADHDDRLRTVVGRLRDPVEEPLADVPTQRVDRRIVDDHEGDVALALETDGFGDVNGFSHSDSQANRTPERSSVGRVT